MLVKEKGRWREAGSTGLAEPRPGADALQPALLRRSGFQAQLRPGVDMIDIANGCDKRTYKSDFGHNRCVNHHYFLICTQGKS
jgi:hypothetical protein